MTLSPTQQKLLDDIVEVFGEDRFHVTTHPSLFITDQRGTKVDCHGVKITTWWALSRKGYVTKIPTSLNWDPWYKVTPGVSQDD